MTDSGGAGWETERTLTVPVYEDHLAFLRDLVIDGDKERATRPRGRLRLRPRLQLVAAVAVGVAAVVVIATLAVVAATIYLCTRAVMLSDISVQSMSRSGVSNGAG
jgi:hypothetical protein